MNKFLSSINLSLELHVVSTFWLESDVSGTVSFYFAQSSLKLERPALRYTYFGAELIVVAGTFLQKYP